MLRKTTEYYVEVQGEFSIRVKALNRDGADRLINVELDDGTEFLMSIEEADDLATAITSAITDAAQQEK